MSKKLDEDTTTANVQSLFDGRTMVGWPNQRGGWPYTDLPELYADPPQEREYYGPDQVGEKEVDMANRIVKNQMFPPRGWNSLVPPWKGVETHLDNAGAAPVEEMTTGGDIAGTIQPFMMIPKKPWPFDGLPQTVPVRQVRKARKDKKAFYDPQTFLYTPGRGLVT